MSDGSTTINAVETSFQIIDVLADHGPLRVTELAEETGVPKGTVHKHLATLRGVGYVVKEEKVYRLSLQYLRVGKRIQKRSKLFRLAKPIVDELAKTTRATTNLMIVEEERGVYLYRNDGMSVESDPLPAVGGRVPLHATAGGKAILSQSLELTEKLIEDHGLQQFTEKTIIDKQELRNELRSIRDQGVAFERGEHDPAVQCVGAPIVVDDEPVGAVSISGNIDRMIGKKLEEDLTGLVVSTVSEIEIALLRQ
ncbi:IclR family transcriptional regulator [Saliphagus infecundisoli]|uniref:IclR family transcriptional regulator n=1 Tax=Saliphagus infecundisoli TaxID=1849069 RepID=A0ABD5Q9T0_9EURY|nr:IclR family transcriptional regulator [Saliphagus infecundisoli]